MEQVGLIYLGCQVTYEDGVLCDKGATGEYFTAHGRQHTQWMACTHVSLALACKWTPAPSALHVVGLTVRVAVHWAVSADAGKWP